MRLLLAAALALCASPAMAAVCDTTNVAGLWERKSLSGGDADARRVQQMAPHEYLRIGADMRFAYTAANRPHGVKEAEAAIDRAAALLGAVDVVDFPEPGVLIIFRDGRPFNGFRCEIADTAGADHQVGDMIWSELPNMPAVRRVQRRMVSN